MIFIDKTAEKKKANKSNYAPNFANDFNSLLGGKLIEYQKQKQKQKQKTETSK